MTDHRTGPRPMGLCPVCLELRHLRAGGLLGQHKRIYRKYYRSSYPCPGVNQPALLEGPHMPEPIPATETLITVYVSIGNSDDKLTQRSWYDFVRDYRRAMHSHAKQVYGEWYSASDSEYQNACMAVAVPADWVGALRCQLTKMRTYYDQDSVAWAVVAETELI
ncbi:MAG: hypothetical protein JWQ81_8587 [Amycolatopsis sp.]|uniref:hypothetical protein n=1 Tax=Amycolatopsis sp. TaxID=37632 RepID=UPI0026055B41|nr:hypothetical protein [Amycolatopsis sp.]MCU1687848.1 hypothetical protein [Amycolatopsis sp.]